ncbi:hypothetical protein CLOM_g24210, partial [Closterium sp. NIES-68]
LPTHTTPPTASRAFVPSLTVLPRLTQQKKTYLEPRKLPDHSLSVPYLFHSTKTILSIVTTSTPFITSLTKVTLHPNFLPDPEDGDEAAYSGNENSPRHTPTGLQMLGLWVSVQHPPPPSPREPSTLSQALGGEHKAKWKEAMEKELKALQDRNT